MRSAVILTSILAILASSGAAAQDQRSAFVETIAGTTIQAAGAVRIGDVLRLASSLRPTSVNGYEDTLDLFSTGVYPTPWRVAIDGVEVLLGTMGTFHQELIPVSTTAIERVVLHPPGWGPGGLSAAGWIHFETRQAEHNSIQGISSAGNQVGDPGPFRYTEPSSTNIDRLGPSHSWSATTGARQITGSVSMRADRAHHTAPNVLNRVYNLFLGERRPSMALLAPRAELNLQARGRHTLQAEAARLEDLPFYEAMGSELPLTREIRALRASGLLGERPSGPSVRYAITTTSTSLDRGPSRFDLDPDWREHRVHARVAVERGLLTVGLSAEQRNLVSLDTRLPWVLQADMLLRKTPQDGWHRSAGVQLVSSGFEERGLHPSVFLEVDSGPGRARIAIRASSARTTVDQMGHELLWLLSGWDYPGPGTGRTRLPSQAAATTYRSLDVTVSRQLTQATVGATGFFRQVRDAHIPAGHLEPDSLFRARYFGDRSYASPADGQQAGLRFWVRQELADGLRQEITYDMRLTPSGSEAFLQRARAVPPVEIFHRLSFSPAERFSFLAVTRFGAGTTWEHFLAAPGSSRGTRLPAYVLLDLAMTKQLWHDRLRAIVRLENLLRSEGRTHPLGPQSDLALVVGIRANLP